VTCFQFHFGAAHWLSGLFFVVNIGAHGLLLGEISVLPGPGYVPPAFHHTVAYWAIVSWLVTTLCSYAVGFVMGRLYVPRV
jgi:predicted DNA repair protein MutK